MADQTQRKIWPKAVPLAPAEGGGPQTEAERDHYLQGLKAQIKKGVYRPDVHELAKSLANMIVREL